MDVQYLRQGFTAGNVGTTSNYWGQCIQPSAYSQASAHTGASLETIHPCMSPTHSHRAVSLTGMKTRSCCQAEDRVSWVVEVMRWCPEKAVHFGSVSSDNWSGYGT
ncbi:hypothetical protein CBR_g44346 [Chara braunii]|uniref:Uncharacterized protein n=1 Tax=Chara braunii TaxID=69332 RepID=A0A388K326_CHABU|nr:hypothetical protein CBR_g44346 [Chara braunii]|eukprot:GBG64461.1 hypothetical protein CBR_g44346 [Chara braunii]